MSKKFLAILAATAASLLVVAVVLHLNPQFGSTGSVKTQAVTIAQAGDFYLYAPLYIAADQGFFSSNGLAVNIVSTGGDDKTWAAVISGSAQVGVADPTFIAIASQRGQPGKIISTIVNGVPFWGITKNPAIPVIKKPSELGNYTVATFPSPSTAYTLQHRMFELGGLTPKIREGGFGTLLALLEAGQADIALELEPNVSQSLGNGYRIVYSLADVYGDFAMTGITTTPEYIKNNPKVVESIVKSIREALDFLHKSPEASASVLSKRFPEIKEAVAVAALRRVLSAGIIPKSPVVAEDSWRKAIQLRIAAGDIKQPSNIMDFVDNTFAK